MKKNIYLLLLMMLYAGVLTACESDEYLGDFNVSILNTLDEVSAEKEVMLYNNVLDHDFEPAEDKDRFDYNNSYIEYINDFDEFGFTDDEMLYIIDDLGSKSTLNEFEEYNLWLLMFCLERYRNYDYGILERYGFGIPLGNDVGEVLFFSYDEEAVIDLDGDGIDETIIVSVIETSNNIKRWNISINGIEPEKEYFVYNPAGQYVIVEIGNKKRIMVSDSQNQDSFSLLFTFDGSEVIDMCSYLEYSESGDGYGLEAMIQPEYTGLNIDNNGDRVIISAPWRLNILQTWSTVKKYELIDDYLYEVPYEEGYYPVKYPVFLLNDINLYVKMNDSSESFVMEKGQVISFIGTDNDKYVKVINKEGRSGWYKVSDYFTNIDNFYGLALYD